MKNGNSCGPGGILIEALIHLGRWDVSQLTKISNGIIKDLIIASQGYAVALTFFRSLKTFRLTCLRMRNKCKIINVQRNKKSFSV